MSFDVTLLWIRFKRALRVLPFFSPCHVCGDLFVRGGVRKGGGYFEDVRDQTPGVERTDRGCGLCDRTICTYCARTTRTPVNEDYHVTKVCPDCWVRYGFTLPAPTAHRVRWVRSLVDQGPEHRCANDGCEARLEEARLSQVESCILCRAALCEECLRAAAHRRCRRCPPYEPAGP